MPSREPSPLDGESPGVEFERYFPPSAVEAFISRMSPGASIDDDFWRRYELLHLSLLGTYIDSTYAAFCVSTRRTPEDGLLVALSGGLDSATALVFATRFAENRGWRTRDVRAVACTRSRPSAAELEDLDHARRVASELEVTLVELDVGPILVGLERVLPPPVNGRPVLAGERLTRARALALHTLADSEGLVTIATGNLSEDLLGQWTTGAFDGQLDLLGELFKTEVWEFAEHLGVPAGVLARPKVTSELPMTLVAQRREQYAKIDPVLFAYLRGDSIDDISTTSALSREKVQELVSLVKLHRHRAYAGEPNVEVSGERLDPRASYAHRRTANPLTGVLDALRNRRWTPSRPEPDESSHCHAS